MSLATRLTAFAQAVGADIKSLNGKITYKGDWNAVTVYKKGDQVWYSNDLWLAVTNVSGAGDFPSSDSPSAWRLVTEGMPIGGDPGQILAKYGANAFETEWIDAPSGGGGGTSPGEEVYGYQSGTGTGISGLNTWKTVPIAAPTVAEPEGAFTRNADGSVTVRDAGWYQINATVHIATPHLYQLSIGLAPNTPGTICEDYSLTNIEQFGTPSGVAKLAAGAKVYVTIYTASTNVFVREFSMTKSAPRGIKGDRGDIGGNALIPVDTWHVIGTGGEPAWQGAWAQVDAARIPRFKKFPDGKVRLGGLLKSGVLGTTAFTLPAGYRPPASRSNVEFATESNAAFGSVYITPAGLVVPFAGTPAQYISLDGIEFDTETVTQMMVGPKGDKGDTGAVGGNATVPIDPWHTVGAVGEPAFINGWTTQPGYTIKFRKDPLGNVHFQGVLKPGTSTAAFVLPVGYRPVGNERGFVCQTNNSTTLIWVNTDGTVYVNGYSALTYVYADSVEFDTETVTQMPTGPKGDKGDTGNIAGTAVKTLDPWHIVGAAGEPQLNSGYTMLDPIHFRKDAFGRVQMRGSFSTCGPNGNYAFTLPVGYRPTQRVRAITIQNQVATGQWEGQININADGTVAVYYTGPGASAYVSLDQIEFDSGTVTELNVAIVGASQVAVPLEGWHTVGQAGEPAYQNGWGVGNQVIKFRKDPFGKVELIGSPTGGASGSVIFTLPVGYRPANSGYHDCLLGGGGATYVNIDATTGNVTSGFGAAGAWLNNIHFDTGLVTTMPAGPKGDKGDSGGVDILTTLNWNTAVTPGFYRSVYDTMGMVKTVNGPGDTLNPPPQAGVVVAHENGYVTQRVYDMNTQIGWTRHRIYDGSWTTWIADLTKPELWADIMAGVATPKDGDERYFQNATMKAAGVLWKFRYDSTAPAGKPKWVFAGGQGFYDVHDGDNFATPANTWVDAGPAGPGFTLPLQGDYTVEFGGRIYSNVPGVYAQIGVSVNGVVDGHSVLHGNFGGGYTDYEDQSRVSRIDNCGQGVLMKLVYNSNPAGGGFQTRWMRITPIRVVM